jgi:hypothetical protein
MGSVGRCCGYQASGMALKQNQGLSFLLHQEERSDAAIQEPHAQEFVPMTSVMCLR